MNEEKLQSARERMVEEQIAARGVKDPRVLAAMRKVPRHRFIPGRPGPEAYADRPLPIGRDQTISQPYIVAYMTELLELQGGEKVLEIGMGSGYQAAVLAELAAAVYTVEKYAALAEAGWEILNSLGYTHVTYQIGDGTRGWPEHQPYDAILVTAGAPAVPEPLKEQMALGARMVIPVGDRYIQELVKVRRTEQGFTEAYLGGCRFVPLVGTYGWK